MRLLSYPDLRELKGIRFSRAHLWRLVRAGKFPKPVKASPGGQASAWVEAEVDEYLNARIAERDAEAA